MLLLVSKGRAASRRTTASAHLKELAVSLSPFTPKNCWSLFCQLARRTSGWQTLRGLERQGTLRKKQWFQTRDIEAKDRNNDGEFRKDPDFE